jgi:glycosyltransferase involved in cell wall biosynthesis
VIPRVLVVTSNNFNLQGGGGITLTNLFRGWPQERLANIHEDATLPDSTVCSSFFRLTRREVRWAWPLSLLERQMTGTSATDGTNALSVAPPASSWKRRIAGDGAPRDVRISPALASWIDNFQPQLVYGFLGSMAQNRLTRLIVDRWQVPLVVHIMDDWPSVIYTSGLLGPILRPRVLREFRELLDRAAARMAISDAMAEEYRARYGHAFLTFRNALDMDEWSAVARKSWEVSSPSIVRYVGSILPEAQLAALRVVCDSVKALRAEGCDITLSVHSPESQTRPLTQWGFDGDVLRIAPPPAASEVPRLLASADVLLLPFNFDAASKQYIRLSWPTKVPAYMVSGTPILVYGPNDVAAVAYATRDGWAEVVSDGDAKLLRSALRRLVTDRTRREALGRRAVELARQNHDILRTRRAFADSLIAAVETHPSSSR